MRGLMERRGEEGEEGGKKGKRRESKGRTGVRQEGGAGMRTGRAKGTEGERRWAGHWAARGSAGIGRGDIEYLEERCEEPGRAEDKWFGIYEGGVCPGVRHVAVCDPRWTKLDRFHHVLARLRSQSQAVIESAG
eukprot:7434787-Pyramimonas_sp.AAC.1